MSDLVMKSIHPERSTSSLPQAEYSESFEKDAETILRQMSLKEKLHQLSGDYQIFPQFKDIFLKYNYRPLPSGENTRLDIPSIKFVDGPRGVVSGQSTCFPVSMARGASFDVELEEKVGDAIGVEMRSQGGNYFGGVCINLLRHPAWGRAQETYGEDTHHLGELGAALVRGVQRHGMACIKHFAVNSIENARFKLSVEIDERTLREVYLPHFKRCIDEGAASVMSSYNKMNGEWCSHSKHLMTDILRDEWKFDGILISDFLLAIRSGPKALRAGLDIEMPYKWHYGLPLNLSLWLGGSSIQDVDRAVKRILITKLRYRNVGEEERYSKDSILQQAHINLARESAQKSIVLLQNNDQLLPISKNKAQSIAVIGRLAEYENIGDHGSSMVRPPKVVTPLEGLHAATQDTKINITYDSGKNIASATAAAKAADIVLVFAGYNYKHEGEYIVKDGGDRDKLTLLDHDEKLITSIAAVNSKTCVTMIGGSAIITEAWRNKVPAIVMAWYPGQEGGHAIADILFGDVNPSAKLPCSFAKSNDDLPHFSKKARMIRYEYLHGYRHLEQKGYDAAFDFGFGLSYTSYAYSNIQVKNPSISVDGIIEVQVDIENTGARDGEEVVQLYTGYPQSVTRAPKDLKTFKRISLQANEKKTVHLSLPVNQLQYYNDKAQEWQDELGTYVIYVGPSSNNNDLLAVNIDITE